MRFLQTVLLSCILVSIAGRVDGGDQRILCILKTPSAHTWEKVLQESGLSSQIVDIASPEIFSEPTTKILLFPDDFMLPGGKEESFVGELRSFLKSGGKVLAVGKAGFNNGSFHLAPLLCAGESPTAYSIGVMYNYKTGKPVYDQEAFVKRYSTLVRKVDGLCFYSFIQLKMPTFLSAEAKKKNIPDFEEPTATVFKNASAWYQSPDGMTQPAGCPAHVKAMWIRDWMLYRNQGMSPEQIIDICRNIGCNLIICGQEERMAGLKMYESQLDLIPGYPEYRGSYQKMIDDGKYKTGVNPGPVQTDWLPRIIGRCRKYEMPLWLATSVRPRGMYSKDFYPEDAGEGAANPMCMSRLSQRFFRHEAMRIEEIMKKFPYISGLVLDEPVHYIFYRKQSSKTVECFCPECKRRFYEYSGMELNEKNAYEKVPDREISEDLKVDTSYQKGERTDIYHQFLQDETIKNCVEDYSLLLKRIKPDAVLAVANYINGGKWENRMINKLADAGVDILMPEFASGSSMVPVRWKHKINSFEFFHLKNSADDKDIMLLWGDAVKVKLFAGANVKGWVSDGNYNYPGIVSANNGNSCYISFDPVSVDYAKGKEIIKMALNGLIKGN